MPALNEEELSGCDRKRYQHRQIRSAGAGSFTVRYQTGRRDGARICPAALDAVISPGTVFAYDVVEEVVRLRYVQLRQREEIRTELAVKGVRISTGSVSNLSRKSGSQSSNLTLSALAFVPAKFFCSQSEVLSLCRGR